MSANNSDWQVGIKTITDRTKKILETGQWSDCSFSVRNGNQTQTIKAHRLILAMASPVFEAMFYGSLSNAGDNPIEISDVQPQPFKALLKYIYSDEILFTSFDQVCDICYAAKKYMIPPLVKLCIDYIWKDLHPGNVCRAYAFVRLFEEPHLLEKCMNMIRNSTVNVIHQASFEEVDSQTLKAIMSEEQLNCTELELWDACSRWSQQECLRQDVDVNSQNQRLYLEEVIPLFRFLTLSPAEFARGPAASGILTKDECYALLMNISAPSSTNMPPSFSSSKKVRNTLKSSFCLTDNDIVDFRSMLTCPCGSLFDIFVNRELQDCWIRFRVSYGITFLGIRFPTQLSPNQDNVNNSNSPIEDAEMCPIPVDAVPNFRFKSNELNFSQYSELIYASIEDENGSRLSYTHYSTPVRFDSFIDITFNKPITLQPNVTYKIIVVPNKRGNYPRHTTYRFRTVHVPNINREVRFEFDYQSTQKTVIKDILFECQNSGDVEAASTSNQNLSDFFRRAIQNEK